MAMAKRTGQGATRRRAARRQADPQVQQRRAVRSRAREVVAEFQTDPELLAAASGNTSLPLGARDQKWDSAAADKAVRTWADATDKPNGKYASAFMVKQGDGTNFGDYKLGYAQPDGDTLKAVWGAITAIAGVLSGARGGADITPAETAAAKSKVESYYAKARTAYDDPNIKVPWASDEASVQDAAAALAYADVGGDEPGLLALATLAWRDQFAAGVAWDPEDGFCDLAEDLTELLNPAGGCRWTVEDVSLAGNTALVCDHGETAPMRYDHDDDDGDYFIVPFTIDADTKEPVLSPQSDWTPVERGWVEGDSDDELTVRLATRYAAMAACANCDHAYTMHLGTDGPCTGDGCDCTGYEQPVTDADGDASIQEAARNLYAKFAQNGITDFGWSISDGQNTGTMGSTLGGSTGTFTLTFDTVTLPDEHQPGERMPRRRPTPKTPPTPESDLAASDMEWSAILAPEGKLTSDGRAFAPDSITWRELPLTLMAMTETSEGGHIGAEVAGKITDIWRDASSGLIRAKGVFDSGAYGTEIARMVGDQTLRGVSVDLAIMRYDVGPKSDWFNEDGEWAPKPDDERDTGRSILDVVYSDEPDIAVVLEAEIGMTTVCPFPAFAEAKIVPGDSLVASGGARFAIWTVTQQGGFTVSAATPATLTASVDVAGTTGCTECDEAQDDAESLTAAAAGMTADTAPPAAWFGDPYLDGPTAPTVTDDGRFFGHAALWATCHIGFPGKCVPPPESHSDYAYFHLGEVACADGERVSVGTVTLDTGHAQQGLSRADATAHYDHTGTAVAFVRCGEDDYGIWFSGTIRGDAPAEKVELLRGSKLSGDWRNVNGNLELVALLTVNVPGFPVPRHRSEYVGADIVSLVAAGMPVFPDELSQDDLARFRALQLQDDLATLAAAEVV
jgi:hypothetical protein